MKFCCCASCGKALNEEHLTVGIMLPLNRRKILRNRFLLPQDSNAPTILLTTPKCKTNTTMGAQIGSSIFATNTTWVLGMEMTTALGENQQWYLHCALQWNLCCKHNFLGALSLSIFLPITPHILLSAGIPVSVCEWWIYNVTQALLAFFYSNK